MIRTFEYAFILAKTYGMLSRFHLGESYRDLLRLRSVEELGERLFPGSTAESGAGGIAADLEARIGAACVGTLVRVLDLMGGRQPLLVHMLRRFEYAAVKAALRRLIHGLAGAVHPDLGHYACVDLAPGPDLRARLLRSPYKWIMSRVEAGEPLPGIESALDHAYYAALVGQVSALHPRDRSGVSRLVQREISLANALWALRLRFSFGYTLDRAARFLLPSRVDRSRRAAEEVFSLPADSADAWRRWKHGAFLASQLGDTFSAPDPAGFEQAASRFLAEKARRQFHQDPFTLTPLAAFFTLKQHEARLLGAAVEGLSLSIPAEDVLGIAGG
jgi:hypothetical protein